MSDLPIPSFMVSNVSELLRSLTKNDRCEQIAQVAHQKWANERNALFLSKSLIGSLFAHFLAKNKQFAQKTDEQIPNPALCVAKVASSKFT